MTLRTIPKAPTVPHEAASRLACEITPRALQHWRPLSLAQSASAETTTISICDPIGFDPWSGTGCTASSINAALQNIGHGDVTVLINSPGGDVFEGMGIYNLLREHPGKVTIKVIGIAASAASVIAMAGDEIQIGRAAFFMIHNTWVYLAGNRNDLRAAADWLEPFDAAMVGIYAERTGQSEKDLSTMLDVETWINGATAIEQGFADSLLSADVREPKKDTQASLHDARHMDVLLARYGVPRSERRKLLQAIKTSTPSAAGASTPSAAGMALSPSVLADYQRALAGLTQAATNF